VRTRKRNHCAADLDHARNRVLRRSDWRFLLSAPYPDVSVVYAGVELAAAVRAVSQRVVDGSREQPPDAGCDLAVGERPDAATLRTMWSALRPGGACYTEWTTRLGPGPARIRQRLTAAGFADVVCYSPRPSPARESSQVWLPLGAASARRWHMSQSHGGLRHHLTRMARRIGWSVANWLPVAVPISVLARKPARSGDLTAQLDAPKGDFQRELRRALAAQRPPGARDGREEPWVLLTPGTHVLNKIVLLAIAPNGTLDFVVKVPRTVASDRAVMREATVLESFVTREPHATFRGAPGQAALRPGPRSGCRGLYLAGAWTDTGWPATMEGAVRSGEAAAEALLVDRAVAPMGAAA